MEFTMNMLLTCIIYRDGRPGCLIKTACKYSMRDSYHGYHICPCMLFFGDAVALLRESYTFF